MCVHLGAGWHKTPRWSGELFSDQSDPKVLIQKLNDGHQDPMNLKLKVVELRGHLITLDNRRLTCLWEHQRHVWNLGGGDVHFRADLYQLPDQLGLVLPDHPVSREFCRKFDNTDGGLPFVRKKHRVK